MQTFNKFRRFNAYVNKGVYNIYLVFYNLSMIPKDTVNIIMNKYF